jgi:hypothetical protein
MANAKSTLFFQDEFAVGMVPQIPEKIWAFSLHFTAFGW